MRKPFFQQCLCRSAALCRRLQRLAGPLPCRGDRGVLLDDRPTQNKVNCSANSLSTPFRRSSIGCPVGLNGPARSSGRLAVTMQAAVLLAVAVVALMAAARVGQATAAEPVDRWQAAMEKFREQDRTTPPPKDPILFVGSSTIRMWNLSKHFPDWPAINRGFGGSQMSDLLNHYDQLIPAYRPVAIVLYEGDNDIAAGKSPQRVLADYQRLVARIERDLPETPVYFLAIKPSIARWNLWPKMAEANRLIATWNDQHPRRFSIDLSQAMLGADGQPDRQLFVKDGLHLSEAGYHLWSEAVRKALGR